METKDFWVHFRKAPVDENPIKIQVFESDSPDECYVPLPVNEEVVQAQRVLLKRADKPKEQVSGSLSTLVAFQGIATPYAQRTEYHLGGETPSSSHDQLITCF
eukprot:Platyproteum_vivax@DN7692_c1_g1_i25.p1